MRIRCANGKKVSPYKVTGVTKPLARAPPDEIASIWNDYGSSGLRPTLMRSWTPLTGGMSYKTSIYVDPNSTMLNYHQQMRENAKECAHFTAALPRGRAHKAVSPLSGLRNLCQPTEAPRQSDIVFFFFCIVIRTTGIRTPVHRRRHSLRANASRSIVICAPDMIEYASEWKKRAPE